MGNKEQNVLRAYELIEHKVGQISKRSSLYSTEPWGFKSDNDFVNSVICVETELSPHEVLKATQAIERQMGRTRKSRGGEYHDRIIDIDILLYDDITVVESDLIIPHPLMKEREFVMKPLREIIDERL